MKDHSRAVNSVALPIVLSCAVFLMPGHLMGQQSSVESKSPQRFSVSSIQIEAPDPGDVPLPPEFRIAVYENLILQIEKTGKFQHVYRSGDKNAANVPDLVTLHTRARAFTEGSQKKREVTTVMGATSLTVNVRITDHASQSIVERDIKGRVVLMGETWARPTISPASLPASYQGTCSTVVISHRERSCLACLAEGMLLESRRCTQPGRS